MTHRVLVPVFLSSLSIHQNKLEYQDKIVIKSPPSGIRIGEWLRMRKQLVFMSLVLAVFFLNSCAAWVGIIAGAGTVGCGVYESSNKERCPALVEVDENLKNLGN